MHIVELRLIGFKSFVDPVRLSVEAGLTGVVGPNGCGKSNLLEAVRWGMGATSARAMRAGDMDDVIFAGSNARPAREHAEVVLVLDAKDAKPPPGVPPSETLEISRRIRRELGSTYRINGKEVRAKDVHLLFADASTGANSPALVRQGQISELIAARAENRRRVLEEAAGLAGLHSRRHDADLKLNAAAGNLERLTEVAGEIEAQRTALKRQARLAERYRTLAEEIRRLEALVLHRRLTDANVAVADAERDQRAAERTAAEATEAASAAQRIAEEARAELPPLREEELVASAMLRRLEGERVGLERDKLTAEIALTQSKEEVSRRIVEVEREASAIGDATVELARLDAELQALAGDHDDAPLLRAQEAAEEAVARQLSAEAELDRLSAASAETRARRAALQAVILEGERRLVRLTQRVEAFRHEWVRLEPLDGLRERVAAAAANVMAKEAAARDAKERAEESEQRTLAAETALQEARRANTEAEKRLTESVAQVKALEAVFAPVTSQEFPPVLASLEVAPGYESAVAAALGDDGAASLNAQAPFRWAGARARSVVWPSGVSPLRDFVKAPQELEARIDACAVVNVEDGARLWPLLSAGARLVSREGDLWRWDGLTRAAGTTGAAASTLRHRNSLNALKAALGELETTAKAAGASFDDASRWHTQAAADAKRALGAVAAAAREVAAATSAKDAASAELARVEARHQELEIRLREAEVEMQDANASLDKDRALLPLIPAADDRDLLKAREDAAVARTSASQAQAQVKVLEGAAAQRANRLKAIVTERAAWCERLAQAEERRRSAQEHTETARARQDALVAAPAKVAAALRLLMENVATAERREASARDALSQAERRVREAEGYARQAEASLSNAREVRSARAERLAAAIERQSALAAQAHEQFQAAPELLAAKAGDLATSALGRGPIADLERRIERLKSERDHGGPVNLRAEEELGEVEHRLASLSAERQDVETAIAKLRQAIGKLNGEARRRLLAAHEIVNKHFADLFGALFEGGQAELRLTEAEDPLACGLEIFAQPPGKRLANLSLMSGGEQALTAAALIFAVFLANPAPICVLDEVDAPLDDANVDRFCKLLEEMKKRTDTRFLVITHNPVTMSRMDRLFGVTMAERGVSQIVSVDLQRAAELAAE